jgi:hypothetical protein
MRRLLRWRVALLVPFCLFAAVVLGGWLYTRSDAAAQLVSRKLQERLGTAATFDRLSVGLTSTSVSGLKVFEHGADSASAEPLVSVDRVELDLSALAAATGESPSAITFRDAHVLLRFDRKGDLLTQFPSADSDGGGLPTVRIESGTLTIRQEGRADSVFTGIHLTVSQTDGKVTIAGTVEDRAWGQWTADGSIPSGGTGHLVLRTAAPHHVTPELLKQVPFVNPNAWVNVRLEGTTTAQLDLSIDMATDRVSYRLALEPTGTTVTIPSIGLHFTDATGTLGAQGAVVTLTDVTGTAAGGQVRLDSRMDFGGSADSLRFLADLTDMDVKALPPAWRVPPQLDGRLTGKLQFHVTLPDQGGTRVEAVGKATIADAKLRGRPVPPIELNVATGAGGGIEFSQAPPTDDGRHEVRKPSLPDPKDVPPAARPVNGRRKGLVSTVLKLAARLLKPANADRTYLNVNVTFRDVDLAELLKSTGVEVPVTVGGKVSVQVQLDIPTETPDELNAYRMRGILSAKRLTVDELSVEGVSAKLDYRDGKLALREFVGRLPGLAGQSGTGGSFRASGEMEVGAEYPYRASVKLDKVALEHVEQLRNLLPVSFRLAGEASAHATLEGTLSPMTLKSHGEAQVRQLRAGTIPADDLTFRWESDADSIRFRDASARLFGGDVSGQFDLPVREDVAASGALKLENLDLGQMIKGLMPGANLRMEGKAAGTVKLRSPAAGEGQPRGATAELDLQAPTMKLQGVPARKIKGTAQYAAGVVKYTLAGEAFGGSFEVAGQYPPAPKKGAARPEEKKEVPKKDAGVDFGRVRLRNMQLSRLWEVVGLKNALGPLDADISGDFPLTTDDAGRLVGTGRLRAERLRWGTQDIAAAGHAVIRLNSTEMIFDEMTFFVGEGVARARATFNRADINQSTASLTLTNVPARRLVFLIPDLASRFDLPVSGRLTTTMGRDWRGSGVLTSARGKVYGVPVTNVRVPIDWVVVPDSGRTQVRVRDLTATAASGPVTGRAELNAFNDLPPRFSGEVRFRNVNLSQAFREAGQVIGNLPISGKLSFGSEQYRGPNDLTARLDARLGESQPFALPVLAAIVPFVTPGGNSNQAVREGEVRAVLGGGVWRIEKATLTGSSVDLYADGTISSAGRLNLAVTATSRQTPGQAVMRRFIPVSAFAPSPGQPLGRALVTDALGLIGNYVVHLEVTGTIDSPVVRLETLRTLTDDAIRFFLLQWALRR